MARSRKHTITVDLLDLLRDLGIASAHDRKIDDDDVDVFLDNLCVSFSDGGYRVDDEA